MVAILDLPPSDATVSGDDVRAAYRAAREAAVHALTLFSRFDAQGGWEIEGASSPTSWLRTHCAFTHAGAAREVRSARLVRTHPEIAEALTDGAITPTHVTQLAAVARHRSQRFGADVAELVDAATHLDPEEYRRITRYWRSRADDLLPAPERDEPNSLDLAETFAGTWVLHGVFDPVRGAALHTLLLERSAPTGADDTRSASERRADALFDALTHGTPVEARVDVLVDVDTFVGTDRPIEDVRCDLQGTGAIDTIVMQRLACNADIGRVLVRGSSEVLELGRRVRLASPAQRRAVIARDRGCVWPQCHRPAAMCEIHHIVPWQDGGPSDLDNLALLCGRHHSLTHQGWSLVPTDGGFFDALPP